MIRPQYDSDIRSLSEFRANTAAFMEAVQRHKRPLILTQHGRSSAVLLDVGEYEQMLCKLEMLQDLQTAEQQINDGLGISHADARARVLERLKR